MRVVMLYAVSMLQVTLRVVMLYAVSMLQVTRRVVMLYAVSMLQVTMRVVMLYAVSKVFLKMQCNGVSSTFVVHRTSVTGHSCDVDTNASFLSF